MYTLPSQKRVKEFCITSEMVERRRAVPGEGQRRYSRCAITSSIKP
jgi:hypothetical protein